MTESYREAKARHARWRQEAYGITREEAIASGMVSAEFHLADIDQRTLDAWRATWIGTHASGSGRWNWPALVERLPRRAAVLPIAVWHGADLCGLALGYASRRRQSGRHHTITLTYAERRPEPPPVPLRRKVIPLVITVAEKYGAPLGASRIRLRNPDRNLLRYYRLLGFEVAWKGEMPVYCEREIWQ